MGFSASDIAKLLGGEVEGDGTITVNNVSKIDQGVEGTLSFLSNPAYSKYIYDTKASVVIVNKDFKPDKEIKCTLIRVDNAYASLAKLLDFYNQTKAEKKGIEQPSFISPTANIGQEVYIGAFTYIGNDVKIGDKVKIYPQVYIGDNVKIGDNTILYPGVKVYADCVIGSSCIFHAGSVIGADGFGFAPTADGTYTKIMQVGNVIIEDQVEIGANTTVDSATLGSTIIKKGVKLDNLVMIGHNCEIGENTVMAAQVGIAGTTIVENNCIFGGQAGVSGHSTIGKGSKIGPQTGTISSVAPGSTLLGTPATDLKSALRSFAIVKNLPELRNQVIQIEKRLKNLEDNK